MTTKCAHPSCAIPAKGRVALCHEHLVEIVEPDGHAVPRHDAGVEPLEAPRPVVVGGFGVLARGVQQTLLEVDEATRAALNAWPTEQTDAAARRIASALGVQAMNVVRLAGERDEARAEIERLKDERRVLQHGLGEKDGRFTNLHAYAVRLYRAAADADTVDASYEPSRCRLRDVLDAAPPSVSEAAERAE